MDGYSNRMVNLQERRESGDIPEYIVKAKKRQLHDLANKATDIDSIDRAIEVLKETTKTR